MGHAALYHQLIVIQKYCHTTLSSKIAILIYLFHNYKKNFFQIELTKIWSRFETKKVFALNAGQAK